MFAEGLLGQGGCLITVERSGAGRPGPFMFAPCVCCRSLATAAAMLVGKTDPFIYFHDRLLDQLNRSFLVAALVGSRFTQRTQRVLKRTECAIHVSLFRMGSRCGKGDCRSRSRHRGDLQEGA